MKDLREAFVRAVISGDTKEIEEHCKDAAILKTVADCHKAHVETGDVAGTVAAAEKLQLAYQEISTTK